MTTNLRHAAGSLLVVGLSGQELTGLERAWLKLLRPAGVILFKRNIANASQTRALLRDATSLCTPRNVRCVDVEGGTVDRLRDAPAAMPSAQAVAQKATETGKDKLIRQQGELIARGVKAFGFNTTLAPVPDLGLPASAGVMGTRCAAATPEGVIRYVQEFLAGLAAHGIVGCGKHFPGLGSGTLDSHAETPSIERSFSQLWREDLAPYREFIKQLPMIMVNHAAYPKTQSTGKPASVSKFWITAMLRKRIGVLRRNRHHCAFRYDVATIVFGCDPLVECRRRTQILRVRIVRATRAGRWCCRAHERKASRHSLALVLLQSEYSSRRGNSP